MHWLLTGLLRALLQVLDALKAKVSVAELAVAGVAEDAIAYLADVPALFRRGKIVEFIIYHLMWLDYFHYFDYLNIE